MPKNDKLLTAANLKDALWETLRLLQDDKLNPAQADSIAAQAREILRTTKVQLQIANQANRNIPLEVINFSEK